MNEIVPSPIPHGTTQAADGFPRLKWTLAEFERLSELGFFGGIDRERERVELVEGELVPMQAKGGRHERVKVRLQKRLQLALGEAYDVFGEPGWRPGGDSYFEPEILVCRTGFEPDTVCPADVLLLVEVADTTLSFDAGVKARIYAKLGVGEYWVVNAKTLETIVHLSPSAEGYTSVATVPPSATATPHRLPALAISLGGLGIV
jgi:Uma2 family endonuclease